MFFSGQIASSTVEEEKYPSPLICFVDKGDEKPVIAYLSKIEPYMVSIKKMQQKMREAYKHSFDVLDFIIEDGIKDENVIAYLCSNRIRDSFSLDLIDTSLPAWGQYIYPPLLDGLSTGDVICTKEEYNNKPFNERRYYVVLSQSCDIENRKISHILIAKCDDVSQVFKKLSLSTKPSKSEGKLISILNAGYQNNVFILPSFGKVLPNMIVDLKELITIEFEKIDNYKKIISLSSPYCERLVWAYMQNACRPGVPSIDVKSWAQKIYQEIGSEIK